MACYRGVAIAALVLGCGDPAPGETMGGSTTAGTEAGSEASATPSVSMTAPGTETGDPPGTEESSGSSSAGATGELPDYADSPCWGAPAQTPVYNGETHVTDAIDVTCRAEGEHTLLYVEDGLWDAGITQADVNRFMHRFELFTPEGSFDPEQGVVVNNAQIFGDLPPGKVEIFVVDTNGGGDGYLCGWCPAPVLHLDGVILDPLDGDFPVSIAAHESYHLIHHAADGNEEVWVDESLAEAAMTANGFFTDLDWLASFMADPDQNWGPGGVGMGEFNYGAGLLWGTYLWERGGPELMRAITAEPTDGWAGLDAALGSVGDDKTAWELYQDLMVAIYLDAPELGYGFEFFDLEEVAREGDLGATSMVSGGVLAYGLDYWRVTATGTLSLTATGSQPLTALAVTASDTVVVTPLQTDTEVIVGPEVTDAFVVVTAESTATYDITVN